jgi:hypothetical protein
MLHHTLAFKHPPLSLALSLSLRESEPCKGTSSKSAVFVVFGKFSISAGSAKWVCLPYTPTLLHPFRLNVVSQYLILYTLFLLQKYSLRTIKNIVAQFVFNLFVLASLTPVNKLLQLFLGRLLCIFRRRRRRCSLDGYTVFCNQVSQ